MPQKTYLHRIRRFLPAVAAFMVSSVWAQAPYPPSTAITNLTWAPRSSIVRIGPGSDGWPVTWGDDGALYTAFADGNGFPPGSPNKLSLGVARVTSGPQNPSGANIPAPSVEEFGDGRSGKKPSGMLMVDGVLYMWVRNANNDGTACQLAWSSDHAQTWTWSSWKFNELGYCVFLNFGQNYAGARDDYVYMYSPDSPSAYDPADQMILTRVSKNAITQRSAYEFFVGLNGGTPIWSADVAQRGAVFSHNNFSARSGISYNAPLGRYLWWQQLRGATSDARYSGGFGVYDAPEPWGPWTTVYYIDNWDVGPGETGSFPPKWMSADGKTIYLVFSGDDSFSVRQATLEASAGPPPALPLPPTNLTVQ